MPWHYEREGRAIGPFDDVEMIRLAESGRIDAISLVSSDGGRTWLSAREAAPAFGFDPERIHSGEAGPAARCSRCAAPLPADEPLPVGEMLCARCRRRSAAPAADPTGGLWQRLRGAFTRPR